MKNRSEAIYQTLLAMLRLQQEAKSTQSGQGNMVEVSSEIPTISTYTEEELMTVREAYLELKISRNTLDELRRQKKLTSILKKRNVRLIRAEVEEAKKWYCLVKGKS